MIGSKVWIARQKTKTSFVPEEVTVVRDGLLPVVMDASGARFGTSVPFRSKREEALADAISLLEGRRKAFMDQAEAMRSATERSVAEVDDSLAKMKRRP